MPFANTDISFFSHSFKNITSSSYKSTKIAHDIRLGYSILGKSVKRIYKDIPSWQSATHLSYILPGISFLCSLTNKDIALDKGAFLWGMVNGLQCYIPILSDSKILTLSAYALDIYLGYLKDKKYSRRGNENDGCKGIRYLINRSETAYAMLVLGNISANVFDQNDVGFYFFEISLIAKIALLSRDLQPSCNSIYYALILTFAPLVLLFSVETDCNLIFSLVTLTLTICSISLSPLQFDNSSQTECIEFSNAQDMAVQTESEEINDMVVAIELADIQIDEVHHLTP